MEPRSSILSLCGVAFTVGQRARAETVDFDLARREVAVVELDDDSDAAGFIEPRPVVALRQRPRIADAQRQAMTRQQPLHAAEVIVRSTEENAGG